jgi:hypothetical protein
MDNTLIYTLLYKIMEKNKISLIELYGQAISCPVEKTQIALKIIKKYDKNNTKNRI